MQQMTYFRLAALAAMAVLAQAPAAFAQQQGPGWFVPGQQQTAPARQAPARPAQRPAPAPSPAQMPVGAPPAIIDPGQQQADQDVQPSPDVPLPPVPTLPALPKQAAPPAAVIGVLGVPEIMRASVAAQAVQKTVGDRRQKLAEDAQKEQAIWRDMQQGLANDRAKLNAEQIRARERELQDRITNAQRSFRERNQVIQDSAQFAFSQIERSLIAVIRQVAEAHGMNLVLHRAQVALNVNEFDITDQVTQQLNSVLPSVIIPPDGITPADWVKQHPLPGATADGQAAPAATPAAAAPAAPAAPAPAKKP